MRILVGIDLTIQGHEHLIDRATQYATRLKGKVDLVFVTPTPHKEHEALLNGLLTMLPEASRGRARVETGDPADGLIALTREYDVMIVGPREPAALQRWLVGPMAVRVMQRSACPIVVPRSTRPPQSPPRLLIGLDATDAGIGKMVEFGRAWSAALEGRLDAVYAIAVAIPVRSEAFRESAEREYLAGREADRKVLAAALEAGVPEGHRGQAFLKIGEPEHVLVQLSASYDTILVGNRGRTGISRLLLGNVADHVVRNAHCDVLVLPTTVVFES